MAETPTTVDEYIDSFPPEAQAILREVRRVMHAAVPGMDETIRYGMPAVMLDGHYVVHLAGWKQHIGMYPIPPLDAELEREIAPYRAAKDTIRLRYKAPIPYELVGRLTAFLAAARRDQTA